MRHVSGLFMLSKVVHGRKQNMAKILISFITKFIQKYRTYLFECYMIQRQLILDF